MHAIDGAELLQWMMEVRVDAGDAPSLEDATNIIEIHDDNGDRLLQYEELETWIEGGSKLSGEQREKIANKPYKYLKTIYQPGQGTMQYINGPSWTGEWVNGEKQE